jgi:hypothetical protein
MAPFKDHTITIEFTVTREYVYEESADIVAKALGISLTELRRIVMEDEAIPTDNLSKLVEVAGLDNEEFEETNIEHDELD